jgi:hypothetical protein
MAITTPTISTTTEKKNELRSATAAHRRCRRGRRAAHIVPDHWVPITLIARQRGWSKSETARAAFQAGTGHVLSTLVIGLVVWFAGVAGAARFGHLVETASSTRDVKRWRRARVWSATIHTFSAAATELLPFSRVGHGIEGHRRDRDERSRRQRNIPALSDEVVEIRVAQLLSATPSPAIPRTGSLPNEVDPAPDFLLPRFARQEGVAENLE